MKKSALLIALLLMTTPALAGEHGDMKSASGWFDMENCAFCKNLTKDPGLLDHMTWESHAIANGMLTISTVEPAYAKSLAVAEAAMEDLGQKMQTGQVNPMEQKMCGHCMAFGQLMMAGNVKMEKVKGEVAEVSLMTSIDPAVVAKLQEMAKRNMQEMASMAGGGDHPHKH